MKSACLHFQSIQQLCTKKTITKEHSNRKDCFRVFYRVHRPCSVALRFPMATQLAESNLDLTSNTSIKNAAQTKVCECCVTEMKASAKVIK